MPLLNDFRARLTRFPGLSLLPLLLLQLAAAPLGYVGQDHDDALYFLAAQSLRQGHYHQWFLPGAPPITNLTPGFPAFLAPWTVVWPDLPAACQWASTLALLGCTVLVWLFLRRREGPLTAWTLTGLFALNPLVLSRLGVVMPEPLFLLGVLTVFLLWESPGTSPWVQGVLLSLLYLIRPAALPLWGAAGLWLILRRQQRRILPVFLLPCLTYTAWALWSRSTGGVSETLELRTLYGSSQAVGAGSVFLSNAKHLADTWGATLLPLPAARTGIARWWGLILFGLAGVGIFKTWREKGPDLPALFLVASLAMHGLWPWWYDRYLVPLLPFLLFFALTGGDALGKQRWRKWILGGWGALGAIAFVGQGLPLLKHNTRVPPAAETYLWIEGHTPPADSFASLFYARDLLYAGRVFRPLPDGGTAADFAAALEKSRTRYVLWEETADFGFSEQQNAVTAQLAQIARFLRDPTFFELAHTDTAGRTRVYKRLGT